MIKRLLLLLVLFPGVAWGGSAIVVKHKGGAPPACPNTNITLWWGCEAADFTGTDGTDDYSNGDAIATLNLGSTVATISSTTPKLGTNDLESPVGANSFAILDITSRNTLSDIAGTVGFWIKQDATGTPPADGTTFQVFEAGVSSGNVLRLRLVYNSAGAGYKVQGYYRSGSDVPNPTEIVTSLGVEIVAGTYYHLRMEWDASQADAHDVLRVYVNGSVKAGDAVRTMAPFTAEPTFLTLGMQHSASLGTAMRFDQLIISSDSTQDLFACSAKVGYDDP